MRIGSLGEPDFLYISMYCLVQKREKCKGLALRGVSLGEKKMYILILKLIFLMQRAIMKIYNIILSYHSFLSFFFFFFDVDHFKSIEFVAVFLLFHALVFWP